MEHIIQDLKTKAKVACIAGTIYASGIPIALTFINNPVMQTIVLIALISMASIEWRREATINSEITSLTNPSRPSRTTWKPTHPNE